MNDPIEDEYQPRTTFVWRKKLEKEGLGHLTEAEVKQLNERRKEEHLIELQKVKTRRLEYEHEREQRDEEHQREQFEKEAAKFKRWTDEEDEFHLKQALLRSEIRIRDGRAKPIDLLAKYINSDRVEDVGIRLKEPYVYVDQCDEKDLRDLLADIDIYQRLEQSRNEEFWDDIKLITNDRLAAMEKSRQAQRSREPVNSAVRSEVHQLFKGKTLGALKHMREDIEKKLGGRDPGTDLSFWETLLALLKAHTSRQRLRDHHRRKMEDALKALKQSQNLDDPPSRDAAAAASSSSAATAEKDEPEVESKAATEGESAASADVAATESSSVDKTADEVPADADMPPPPNPDADDVRMDEYQRDCYSPVLVPIKQLKQAEQHVIDPEEDETRLRLARSLVRKTGSGRLPTNEDRVFEREARKGMNDDEVQFSVEAQVDYNHHYVWSEKYRPRKPRYFNRVHTGFEWNKYNQTHYDIDNPPPKIVQGYKFNIFYPDLIDLNSVPEYKVIPDSDNKEFAVLRISAGPPYEDIAFKIVNREWEFSHRRGFRCQFHNKIFQLWFHFKKYRYRR